MNKYDIAIIGAGPGGYGAALYAAGCGMKAVLIEKDLIGGECLNRGCIPTKTLISGLGGKERPNLASLVERKEEVVARLRSGVEGLLKAKSVEIKRGFGKLTDKGVVNIGNERIETKSIIIASGSRPIELSTFKFDGKKILSSEQMLNLKETPKRLLIVGGGFIGCEFAYIYNALGSDVTIVEMMQKLLPGMDAELAKNMESILKKKKIKVLTGAKADESFKEAFDLILVSVGRRPNIEGLGLERLGIKIKDNCIAVDNFLRTSADDVYAIGDVIGGKMLAHVAFHEGINACNNIMGKQIPMDYSAVPACVYTEPQIASVGLTEEEAESNGYKTKTSKFPFSASGKAQAIGRTEGFVKMVADEKTGIILGVHMVGAEATDLIGEAVLMVKSRLKATDVAETMHAHPTLAEVFMEAAFSLCGRPIHML